MEKNIYRKAKMMSACTVGFLLLMLLLTACGKEPETQPVIEPSATPIEQPEVLSTTPTSEEGSTGHPDQQQELNPYQETRSIKSKWGEAPEEFGLREQEEMETLGPYTFALDRSGKLHIVDTIKGQIKTFSETGAYQNDIAFEGRGSDIVIGDNGDVFSLEGENLAVLTPEGEMQSYELSAGIPSVEGYGQGMRFDEAGNLYVCKLQQCYQIGAVLDGNIEVLLPEEQTENIKPGFPIKGNEWARMKWEDDHEAVLEIMDDESTVVREIQMTTSDVFGAVGFLQQDENGFFYIEVERITADNDVHLDVWKYSAEGELVSITELPNDYYSTVNKKVEVDQKGIIHQVMTTPEGVKLLTWEPK